MLTAGDGEEEVARRHGGEEGDDKARERSPEGYRKAETEADSAKRSREKGVARREEIGHRNVADVYDRVEGEMNSALRDLKSA